MNDQALPYIAAAITTLAGIFGFFWARSGERNKVGGVGWAALVLIVAGGLLAVVQTYRASQRAAAAGARAEELSEDLRRAQLTTSAAVLTLVNGFDLTQPLGSIGFYVSVPNGGGGPVRPPGFVGPFPALPNGARGTFRIWLDGVVDQTYELTPTPRGGIRLSDPAGTLPAFTLEQDGNQFVFRGLAPVAASAETGIWSAQPDTPGPSDDLPVPTSLTPPTDDEVANSSDYLYAITFASTAQLRKLISQLVRQPQYGQLVLQIPGAGEAEIERMVQGFAQMSPTFVFTAPMRAERAGAESECPPSLIRVPMHFRRVSAPGAPLIVFALVSDPRGFRNEPCEGGP